MKDENNLQSQIESAKDALSRYCDNKAAVVTESRLYKNSRRTMWGFCFKGGVTIGDEYQNDDGSFSIVRAVVVKGTVKSGTSKGVAYMTMVASSDTQSAGFDMDTTADSSEYF